jgi:hypothetical protein
VICPGTTTEIARFEGCQVYLVQTLREDLFYFFTHRNFLLFVFVPLPVGLVNLTYQVSMGLHLPYSNAELLAIGPSKQLITK